MKALILGEVLMRLVHALAVALLAAGLSMPAVAADLHIDIPVELKDAKVVFNMDHLAFEGSTPTGINYMSRMSEKFVDQHTQWQMIAIFHGPAGYMLLNDDAYNRFKKSTEGNPYKQIIAKLQARGIHFEECGLTAHNNGWVNADLLPNVAVNSGAEFRLVQLIQGGFVQLQP
jgi:uncharacterized protein